MMPKKVLMVVGYDNSLTTQDLSVIKKMAISGLYQLRLIYYIPA
jgi:hypothetical protein